MCHKYEDFVVLINVMIIIIIFKIIIINNSKI